MAVKTKNGEYVETYLGFNSQLGVGAIIPNDEVFTKTFLEKSAELRESFNMSENLPFFSSTQLKRSLGFRKAISFTDQVITAVQELISTLHCSYVILPPKKIKAVPVGGFGTQSTTRPTNKFIDDLGPMFSYLTAHSYLHRNNYTVPDDLVFHIDAFRSKRTKAWEDLINITSPKVFWRGDECNPFIACADLMAFLTDAKLYNQRLKLEPNDVKKAWSGYSFDVTVDFYGEKSLGVYSWFDEELIDITSYMARPTVFLAIDDIENPEYSASLSEDEEALETEPAERKFKHIIKRSDVYHSAVRYAFQKHGSVKIFQSREDMKSVQDGDVFVYVGSRSKNIGEAFLDSYEIELLSGKELRRKKNENI